MVVGVLLIGTIVFSGLTPPVRNNFLSSLNIFDVHEQAAQSAQDIQLVLGAPQEFYEQFYLAFTQVAVLPKEPVDAAYQWSSNIKVAYSQFQNFSDQIVFDYRNVNKKERQIAYANVFAREGRVAGASINLVSKPNCVHVPNFYRVDYHAPTWQELKQLIKVDLQSGEKKQNIYETKN